MVKFTERHNSALVNKNVYLNNSAHDEIDHYFVLTGNAGDDMNIKLKNVYFNLHYKTPFVIIVNYIMHKIIIYI